MDNNDNQKLNMEDLEDVSGDTPISIPGGKRSGRKNTENALEIADWLENKSNSILEDLGMKEKRVNNSIYDRTIKDFDS